jgi:hypothetical protein
VECTASRHDRGRMACCCSRRAAAQDKRHIDND